MRSKFCTCCGEVHSTVLVDDTDRIYICGDCLINRKDEVEKIYMRSYHYWTGCYIGHAKGICPNCRYDKICTLQHLQINSTKGVS